MKKVFFIWYLILPFCFLSCTEEKADAPIIRLIGVSVNLGEVIEESDEMVELPLLEVGDQLDILLELDGNGSDLNSLNVKSDEEGSVKFVFWPEDYTAIEEDKNFTDYSKGYIGFKDGVTHFLLSVKATVLRADDDMKICFHLSNRAKSQGGLLELEFGTASDVETAKKR